MTKKNYVNSRDDNRAAARNTEDNVIELESNTYPHFKDALDDLVVFNFFSFEIFLCFNDFFDFNWCNIAEFLLTLTEFLLLFSAVFSLNRPLI